MLHNGEVKRLTTALAVPTLTMLLIAGCGGSTAPKRQADDPVVATTAPRPGSSGKPPGKAGKSVTKPGATAARATAPAGATSRTTAPGSAPSAEATSTAPGSYTYDSKGNVTVGAQTHDASGSQTLKVDKPSGANQHSELGGDRGGGTQQDVVHKDTGTYLARLVINAGGSPKEFHPAQPVLGVPKPQQIGRTWSWSMTSTDGKTHAAYSAKFTRTEVVTIGGVRVNAWVIESTLKLTGDFTYNDQETVDYDPSRLLQVRMHQRGSGSYLGTSFTSDATSTLRSVRPS